ncbi:MAG: transporter substrate-binding domain-containing protein [bacterium]
MIAIVFFLYFTYSGNLYAEQNTTTSKKTLYIGIEKNRLPYTHIDQQKKIQGFIAQRLQDICHTIDQDCEFIAKGWDQLLNDLQLRKIDTIVVIDNVLLPEIDDVSLSSPICRMTPVFVIHATKTIANSIDDFRSTTIGVRRGSTFHFHLLNEYSNIAKIKDYRLLENAIFDLSFDRVDSILMDQTVFSGRIKPTPIANKESTWSLMHFPMNNTTTLPDKHKHINIALVTKKGNERVINDIESILKEFSQPVPFCNDLVEDEN